MLTAATDAHENRDVVTADVPNAFMQTELPNADGEDRVVMKTTGALVLEKLTCRERITAMC